MPTLKNEIPIEALLHVTILKGSFVLKPTTAHTTYFLSSCHIHIKF